MPRRLFVAARACVAAGGPAGGSRGETAAPPHEPLTSPRGLLLVLTLPR